MEMDTQQQVTASIRLLNRNLMNINDYWSIAVFYGDILTKVFFIDVYTKQLKKTLKKNVFVLNTKSIFEKHSANVIPRSSYIFDVQALVQDGVDLRAIKNSFINIPRTRMIWAVVVDGLNNVDKLMYIPGSPFSLMTRI